MTIPTTPDFSNAPSTTSLTLCDKGDCVSVNGRDPFDFEGCVFPRDLSLRLNPSSKLHPYFPKVQKELVTVVSERTESKDTATTSSLHGNSIISDEGINNNNNNPSTIFSPSNFHPIPLSSQLEREELSRSAHEMISQLNSARESHDNQRWAHNPAMDGAVVRLVAGCIPILPDGRILMITSRTKDCSFLGLPKGGWELDESLEEGALRETFEEAGALGILGPPLPSFLVVSGKNKTTPTKVKDFHPRSSTVVSEEYADETLLDHVNFCSLSTLVPLTPDLENLHTGPSDHHSHTWMTFFPLYVTQIMKDWPESTRQRRAYPIQGTVLFF
jgi:8-oxo-dGTP pyrophosphatase MutT (NUDIX family)